MDPLTAALLAAGVSASIPYAVDAGKYLWNEGVDPLLNPIDDDDFDLTPINAAQRALETQEDAAMAQQLSGYQQASGKAIGAQIAQSMGTGITGMSPVSLLQATQGEQMANRQIADLGLEQAQVSAQRFADSSAAAQRNIAEIRAQGYGRIKTRAALDLYADSEQDDAVRQLYMNAMV